MRLFSIIISSLSYVMEGNALKPCNRQRSKLRVKLF